MIINGFGGTGQTIIDLNANRAFRNQVGMHECKNFYYNGAAWPITGEATTEWDSAFNESDNVTLGSYTYTANTALALNTTMKPSATGTAYAGRLLYEIQGSAFPHEYYGYPGFLVLKITRNINSTYWTFSNSSYSSVDGTNYMRFYYSGTNGPIYNNGTYYSYGTRTTTPYELYYYGSISNNLSYYFCFGNSTTNTSSRRIVSFGGNFLPNIKFYTLSNNATLNTNVTVTGNTTFTWTVKFLPCYPN